MRHTLIALMALMAPLALAGQWTPQTAGRLLDLHDRGQMAEADTIAASLIAADGIDRTMAAADSCFFTAGSPTECEALYALFLEHALAADSGSDMDDLYLWQLESVCEVNAEGTPAADFCFALLDGPSETTLGQYVDGRELCLIFYDPDCQHCAEVMAELQGLSRLTRVLAVCTGSTPERWRQTATGLPRGWAAAFDRSSVQDDDTYVIRSFPSIYLIDKHGTVQMKNPSPRRLLHRLNSRK